MYLYTLKQLSSFKYFAVLVVNRFKKNVSLHVETTDTFTACFCIMLWIALKKMYLYTLKQRGAVAVAAGNVVNRFKKNVSLHVETTTPVFNVFQQLLWIALKKMYLYTLKQLVPLASWTVEVVNRFKKNVSLHVETTMLYRLPYVQRCESL